MQWTEEFQRNMSLKSPDIQMEVKSNSMKNLLRYKYFIFVTDGIDYLRVRFGDDMG